VRVRKYNYEPAIGGSTPPEHQDDMIEDKSVSSSHIKQTTSMKKEPNIATLVSGPSNYDALVAVFVDGQCLERSEVIIKVVIQELQVDIIQNIYVP
jgi:hypothetical protein